AGRWTLLALVAAVFCGTALLNWTERKGSEATNDADGQATTNALPQTERVANIESPRQSAAAVVQGKSSNPVPVSGSSRIAYSRREIEREKARTQERIAASTRQPSRAVPKYREASPPGYSNDNYQNDGRRAPQQPADSRSSEEILASWNVNAAQADRVDFRRTSVLDSPPAKEPGSNPDEVLNQIETELKGETNTERQIALLSRTVEASSDDAKVRKLLEQALDSTQNIDVRRQALYLLTQIDRSKAQEIAKDDANPLNLDAKTFLLQDQIASGNPPVPTEDPQQ
ncbi:MAG: hypothetical protein ACXWIU_13465, partial [Limisphaerales bacterium]